MDYNNIDYSEINYYKGNFEYPTELIQHFRCTCDKETGKMVEDDGGEFVIFDAAVEALILERIRAQKDANKGLNKLKWLMWGATIFNLVAAIINIIL